MATEIEFEHFPNFKKKKSQQTHEYCYRFGKWKLKMAWALLRKVFSKTQ